MTRVRKELWSGRGTKPAKMLRPRARQATSSDCSKIQKGQELWQGGSSDTEMSRLCKDKDKDKNMEVAQTPRSQDCFAHSRWPSASSRQLQSWSWTGSCFHEHLAPGGELLTVSEQSDVIWRFQIYTWKLFFSWLSNVKCEKSWNGVEELIFILIGKSTS